MKNAVFRDVTPCGCFKNLRFGGTYRLHHQDEMNQRARNVSSNWQLTLMMEAIHSSETSVFT
jgi:hypothetical protein